MAPATNGLAYPPKDGFISWFIYPILNAVLYKVFPFQPGKLLSLPCSNWVHSGVPWFYISTDLKRHEEFALCHALL